MFVKEEDLCRDIKNRIIILLNYADNVAEQKVNQNDIDTFHRVQNARASLFKLKASIKKNSIEHVSRVLSDIQMTLMITQTITFTPKVVIATPIKNIDTKLPDYEISSNEPSTPPVQFTTINEEIACEALLYL